jgi:hypothetical protein
MNVIPIIDMVKPAIDVRIVMMIWGMVTSGMADVANRVCRITNG